MATINNEIQQLVENPHETLNVEVKSWLDLTTKAAMATLAKAAIALANHGGGTILLGLSERTDGTFEVAEPRPATLEAYSQDSIARIVSSYAEPPFQVQVIHAERRESNSIHPVVIVPGGHRVPIQAKKGSPDQKTLVVGHVYIRRPTPESAEPATAMEWRDLLDRCVRAGKDDLLDAMRSILDGRSSALETTPETALQSLIRFRDDGLVRWRKSQTDTDPAAPQPLGYYCASYSILGDFTPPGFNELRGFIDRATVRHSGWSPFWVPTRNEISPYVRDEAIECNLDEGAANILPTRLTRISGVSLQKERRCWCEVSTKTPTPENWCPARSLT